jgi:hypothetical protein
VYRNSGNKIAKQLAKKETVHQLYGSDGLGGFQAEYKETNNAGWKTNIWQCGGVLSVPTERLVN